MDGFTLGEEVISECSYAKLCTAKGKKCDSCKHLPVRSYYEPVDAAISKTNEVDKAGKVVRNVVVRLPEDVGMTFLGYPVKLVVESKP